MSDTDQAAQKTTYIVLRRFKAPQQPQNTPSTTVGAARPAEQWDKVADITASSAEQAIRAYAGKENVQPSGTYVAIPARSFKPVTVKAETTTTLKLENVGT